MTRATIFSVVLLVSLQCCPYDRSFAQTWTEFPVIQSELASVGPQPWRPLTLRQASRDDRWLGLEVRDVIWSPDGQWVYFRWNLNPKAADVPELDPWFRVRADSSSMEQMPYEEWRNIPADNIIYNDNREYATWSREGMLYLWDRASGQVRGIVAGQESVKHFRFSAPDAIEFQRGAGLFKYNIGDNNVEAVAVAKVSEVEAAANSRWLVQQQKDLFEFFRKRNKTQQSIQTRSSKSGRIPEIELPSDFELDWVGSASNLMDGDTILWIARKDAEALHTEYMDYVHESGAATVQLARPKVGAPDPQYIIGWLSVDAHLKSGDVGISNSADSHGRFEIPSSIREMLVPPTGELVGENLVIHPPQFSPDGKRAVLQISSMRHKDRWVVEVDWKDKSMAVLFHDHDEAWLGGPEPVAGFLSPAWLRWLDNGSVVLASERSGWSHLYVWRDGELEALTEGEWEVRGVQLSHNRQHLLLTASADHASDDHLYRMATNGGELQRISAGNGRHKGVLDPSGRRVAMLSSDAKNMPDLFLGKFEENAQMSRITFSGTDNFHSYPMVKPELVSFPHPDDGKPVWAMVYSSPNPNGAGVLHVHGGGYRQFSHHGWSVYGYALHLGLLQYLVGQGYTVLDFDYRGSAGYGRDYRTDIYRDMGNKDVNGVLPVIDYLVTEKGVSRDRVGVYGISYGGFFTLAALFKHPGVFAAGIANAAVADWAHYNERWTGRILNTPQTDEEAYLRSSPINQAEGLEDPLLIVHGLMDDNVQFQDAARIVQKLIELEKSFEIMIYPVERHTIQTESSRLDYVKRVDKFFANHLLEKESDAE